jgi:hypothetical protein
MHSEQREVANESCPYGDQVLQPALFLLSLLSMFLQMFG